MMKLMKLAYLQQKWRSLLNTPPDVRGIVYDHYVLKVLAA